MNIKPQLFASSGGWFCTSLTPAVKVEAENLSRAFCRTLYRSERDPAGASFLPVNSDLGDGLSLSHVSPCGGVPVGSNLNLKLISTLIFKFNLKLRKFKMS